jgi:asparagine synthase (glutamine-hydrolysing)
MSGISGIVRFDGAPADPAHLHAMTAAMSHRGPDGIGHWVKGSVALGQCMLRTTPESLEETQPLANEDESVVLVMDGRTDNWEELRAELLSHGARLRTRADAELVLRAYETWGDACLSHVDGDFAIAIWDARQRRLFCARDRFGNKPFHYHWDGKVLTFASELHAILAMPWVPERLNEGMVAEALESRLYSVDETFWQGVLRLPPAHALTAGTGVFGPSRYWKPRAAVLRCSDDDDYIARYRAVLQETVRRLSRSHRPVACEVSGGHDSSAVFALAIGLASGGCLPAPGVDGYTLAFPGDPGADELSFARAVGTHLGVSITEVAPSRPPVDWYREHALFYRDFPGYPNGAMATGLRSLAFGRGSRVVLTGSGGDEWTGGTRLYYAEALESRAWSGLLDSIREDGAAFGAPTALGWLLRFGLWPLMPTPVRSAVRMVRVRLERPAFDTRTWLQPRLHDVIKRRRRAVPEPMGPFLRAGQRIQAGILVGAYGIWAREIEERMAARLGLEQRHPFWSLAPVEFAFALPERMRIRGERRRYAHLRALEGALPPAVIERRSKADFTGTLRTPLPGAAAALDRGLLEGPAGWIRPGAIHRLLDLSRGREPVGAEWVLWGLVGCEPLLAPHQHGVGVDSSVVGMRPGLAGG